MSGHKLCFSNSYTTESPEELLIAWISRPVPRDFDSAGLWQGARICTFNKFPDDAVVVDATNVETAAGTASVCSPRF